MRFEALLAFTGACLCSVLGVGALYKKPHALVSRTFTLGMLVLALRETLMGSGGSSPRSSQEAGCSSACALRAATPATFWPGGPGLSVVRSRYPLWA